MNNARMTIRLPGETLRFVQGYARSSRISLSELVLRYFDRLREAVSAGKNDVPASVSKVAGIIPPHADIENAYRGHLAEKYL